jgi:hypothetical protein
MRLAFGPLVTERFFFTKRGPAPFKTKSKMSAHELAQLYQIGPSTTKKKPGI